MTEAQAQETPPRISAATRAIGGATLVLMFGNLTVSIFGFVRQFAIAKVYGATAATDAFFAASIVPQMFYDLVIGAAVSAALIPVFTEILERQGRDTLWKTLSSVLSVASIALLALVVVLEVVAQPLMSVILWGYHQQLHSASRIALAVEIVRVLVPSLLFLGMSAILLACLYSLRRFTVPAFSPVLYHFGVIAGAVLLARPLGIMALPVGALAGAAAQCSVQGAALLRLRPRLSFRPELTPEIRRILRLYAPVAAGLLVSIAGQIIDLGFKSNLETSAITTMQLATTLTQFPIGIAVAALSFATLPSISSDAALGRMDQFKDTLATGIRFVLFLTIPAAVGFLALSTPIVSLLFQHGVKFTPVDTDRTSIALVGYAIQIPFVGLDQLLIFSFYARKNTVTPMLVGIAGVLIYIVSALILGPAYRILGLALANSIQNSAHALILLVLLFYAIGSLGGRGILVSILKALVAASVMGVAAFFASLGLRQVVNAHVLLGQAVDALIPLSLAIVLYLGVSAVLRSSELRLASRIVADRF